MGILNKFLDAVKVNDDYEEDDYLDDMDDGFEEDKPKKRFFKKLDDDYDDDFDDYPPMKATKKVSKQESAPKPPKQPKQPKPSKAASSKVTPMYSVRNKTASGEVCVFMPKTYEDSKEIVDALSDNCTVILNLEGLEVNVAQYIIDFALGASYSMQGHYQEISSYIFIFTPQGVDITGDSKEVTNTFARTGF